TLRSSAAKLSHGNLDGLGLVASSPGVDHTFTGLGQVLLPVLTLNRAGAIDGLASVFTKTVVRIFRPVREERAGGALDEPRKLQQKAAGRREDGGQIGRHRRQGTQFEASRLRRQRWRQGLAAGRFLGDAELAKWKDALDGLEAVERTL
ncbi:4-hydroxy-2-oxoglutarate mitochondrial, partial [Diplodia corticola]